MKVPEHILTTAKQFLTHGDIQNIADINKLSRYEVQQVFNDADPTPEAVAAVAAFYEEKKSLLSDYLN
jgi:hypothetical protein